MALKKTLFFLYLSLFYVLYTGIGFGMIYLPAIVTVGHWFDKKRAFATGLAVCGTGIGTFLFPPLAKRLIDEYDWRGAHLILAGIVLNCAVCGALFKPVDKARLKRKYVYQEGGGFKQKEKYLHRPKNS